MVAADETPAFEKSNILASATQIISAHLVNNPVALPDVPGFIKTVFSTLAELEHSQALMAAGEREVARSEAAPAVPAVNVNASVQPEYIVCLEDGRKLRMLKRYLMAQYGMTPQQYRAKWGLSDDYPMAAPMVSEQRRKAAQDSGLGRTLPRKPARRKLRMAQRQA